MSRLLTVLLFFSFPIKGDELLISSSEDWAAWDLPGDALIVENGRLSPGLVRRSINAVANAGDFGGGIRSSGSDASNSFKLIDGDPSTFWTPDINTTIDQLGLKLSWPRRCRNNRITFRGSSGFTIWTSDGEPSFNNTNSVIPELYVIMVAKVIASIRM